MRTPQAISLLPLKLTATLKSSLYPRYISTILLSRMVASIFPRANRSSSSSSSIPSGLGTKSMSLYFCFFNQLRESQNVELGDTMIRLWFKSLTNLILSSDLLTSTFSLTWSNGTENPIFFRRASVTVKLPTTISPLPDSRAGIISEKLSTMISSGVNSWKRANASTMSCC